VQPSLQAKQQLQDIQQTIAQFEKAGADLLFSKPEMGLVVRLRPGIVDLVVNDGHRCKVVSINLSHPSNAKLLNDLALGLKDAKSLGAIESPLIRLGMTLQCLTQPFFEKMSHAKGDTVKITTAFDGSHKLVRLKAEIPGQGEAENVEDAQILEKVNTKLKELGVHGKYSVEISSSRVNLAGLTDETHRMAYLSWLTEPLPAPSAKRSSSYQGLTSDEIAAFERLLTQSVDSWKPSLWSLLKDHGDSAIQICTQSADSKDVEKRACLQAIIDEYANLF
jgi:hypothetical protein